MVMLLSPSSSCQLLAIPSHVLPAGRQSAGRAEQRSRRGAAAAAAGGSSSGRQDRQWRRQQRQQLRSKEQGHGGEGREQRVGQRRGGGKGSEGARRAAAEGTVVQQQRVAVRCRAAGGEGGEADVAVEAGRESGVTSSPSSSSAAEWWQWKEGSEPQLAGLLLLASCPLALLLPQQPLSAPFYFLCMALWAVYFGSHRSLEPAAMQQFNLQQGLAVPLLCSFSLLSLYLLLTFLPDLNIAAFISAYLSLVGGLSVASAALLPLKSAVPPSFQTQLTATITLPLWLLSDEGEAVQLAVGPAEVAAAAVGVGAIAGLKLMEASTSFPLSNAIAMCIVAEMLGLLALPSLSVAAAMLSGLLLYDVFWVFASSSFFGDNVMVTVATSSALDGPMKLIFPRVLESSSGPYSILGLGDVALPGLLLALLLRFDKARAMSGINQSLDRLDRDLGSSLASPLLSFLFQRRYFSVGVATYVLGFITTIGANFISGAAQPALLYLVPSMLGGVALYAASRSELSQLLDYKDDPNEMKI